MERSEKRAQTWEKRYKKSIGGAGAALKAFIGLFAFRQAASFYQSHIDGIDNIAKQADKLGLTTEALQGLRHAGELSGVSINTMDMAIQRLTRRVAEAAQGTGEAKSAIEELGLSAEALARLSPDQQMQAIARAMANVATQGDRVRLAMRLFDSEGVALVNTLALGEDGLKQAALEVEQLGLSFSRIDAAKIELANDEFQKANTVVKGFGQRIAMETAPIVGALSSLFVSTSKSVAGTSNTTTSFARKAVPVIGFVTDVVNGLKVVWLGLRQVIAEVTLKTVEYGASVASLGGKLADKLGFGDGDKSKFEKFAESYSLTVASMREELEAAANAKPPSERIEAYLNNYLDELEVKAQQIAADRSVNLGDLLINQDVSPETDPRVLYEASVQDEIARLNDAEKKARLRSEAAFQKQILDFQAKSSKQKVLTLISEGVQLTRGASHTSKKLFSINKALALADAAVTLPSAVLKAVERGGGWPFGAFFGALTLANGLARIRAIKNAKFGGGVSSSLAGSGGGALPTRSVPSSVNDIVDDDEESGAAQQRGLTQVILNGDFYGRDGLDDQLVDSLARLTGNNRLRVSNSSGQTLLEVT